MSDLEQHTSSDGHCQFNSHIGARVVPGGGICVDGNMREEPQANGKLNITVRCKMCWPLQVHAVMANLLVLHQVDECLTNSRGSGAVRPAPREYIYTQQCSCVGCRVSACAVWGGVARLLELFECYDEGPNTRKCGALSLLVCFGGWRLSASPSGRKKLFIQRTFQIAPYLS